MLNHDMAVKVGLIFKSQFWKEVPNRSRRKFTGGLQSDLQFGQAWIPPNQPANGNIYYFSNTSFNKPLIAHTW